MSGLARLAWLTLAAILLISPDVWAQKVDVVRLKNGDRLTCEITNLEQGVLTVSTDPLGTVKIHWGQIESLVSPRGFMVQMATGFRYYGALGAANPGEVIVIPGGDAPVTLPLADIVELRPIGQSFWRRIDGNLDVGFSFAQANLETRGTLNAAADYRSRTYHFGAAASSQVTTREDVERQYRADVNLTASRYLSLRWYSIFWGGFQQNDELSLDVRYLGGGGLGREIVHTNHRLWSLYGGLAYTRELYTDQPLEQSTEAALGGQMDFFSADNNDFTITNRVATYVHLGGRRRFRVELNSAWRQEFLSDFYWSLNGFESFDSDPPQGDNQQKQNDFGVSFSIGWKF